jgi:alpha-amylase/alpha-mannosidase (GH57 family)
MAKKYFCIHGHFYQPPRENPWTETLERQPSATPHHDWNQRIARECYIPNSQARLMDKHGLITELVNNYEYLSFNFGPTLMAWFEKEYPRDYRRLMDADAKSARRLGGHGNAIAQAYNHIILPLANARDLRTQILWGLADFKHRFGRAPEAMWIPETACNDSVLTALAEHGLKYAVLAPSQAKRVRRIGEDEWSEGVDHRRPYRWTAPDSTDGKSLALFFYDGPLSHAVAFEKAMINAAGWADRILGAFDPAAKEDQLVNLCTDGESYGHHEKFGEMGLAHLLAQELPKRGIHVVNYAAYLAEHEPTWEAEIKPGDDGLGTSWSCAHGVGRWSDACGCGAEGKSLAWRKPLREALDWLRDHMALIFEREGGRVLRDPWAARDAYISLVLDRSEANVASFMRDHLKDQDSPENRAKALGLLEMQRQAMLMYTSCGWFFSDVSGIETVQNLQYAARAAELAHRAAGVELERGLSVRLKDAPCNYAEHGDGQRVFLKLALAGRVDEDRAAAHHAIAALFGEDGAKTPLGSSSAEFSGLVRHLAGGLRLACGRVETRDGITGARAERIFLAAAQPDLTVSAWVGSLEPGGLEALSERVRTAAPDADLLVLAGPLAKTRRFAFSDLLADERERIVAAVVEKRREVWDDSPLINIEECLGLAEQHLQLGLDMPPGLRGQTEAALDAWLLSRARRLREKPDEPLDDLGAVMARAKAAGLSSVSAAAEEAWELCAEWILDSLSKEFTAAWLKRLSALAAMAPAAGLTRWRDQAQSRFFDQLRRLAPDSDEKIRLVGEIDEAARLLYISADAMDGLGLLPPASRT